MPRRRVALQALAVVGALGVACALTGCGEDERPSGDTDEYRPTVDAAYQTYRKARSIATGMRVPQGIGVGPAPRGSGDALWVVGDRALTALDLSGKRLLLAPLEDDAQCVAASGDRVFVGAVGGVLVHGLDGRRIAAWPATGPTSIITSIASAGGDVWVADAAMRLVYRYTRDGKRIGSIGARDAASGYPGLVAPSPHLDVAVRDDGSVFVSNPGERRIERWTVDGKFLSAWGSDGAGLRDFCGCCNPTDFALLAGGRFVTSEKGIPRVKVYGAEGDLQAVPATYPDGTTGIDVATTRSGQVLALDPRARAIDVYERKP